METNRKWVIVRIDGKIASISADYRALAEIAAKIVSTSPQPGHAAKESKGKIRNRKRNIGPDYQEITAKVIGFDEVWKLRSEARWEDLLLMGTEFQKKVWRKLWELTHPASEEQQENDPKRLLSYSDFAELCDNKAGVRAVAHAIGLNPIAVVIPCHLIVPKESIDRISDIQKKAESTIFKGEDLCIDFILNDKVTDFGEYALGKDLKRKLIQLELAQ